MAVCALLAKTSWALAQDDPHAPQGSAPVVVPSGLEVTLQEMLWDRPGGGLVYRFRFVAPAFTGDESFETQSTDLEFLCNGFAVERLAEIGPMPSRIVISIADEPSEFGVFDADVTQVFESYSLQDGACVWEMH